MRTKSVSRTSLRVAAGIIVICLSFAAIAGATTLADGTQITAEQATCWVAPASASGTQEISFSDVTDQEGITDQVTQDRFGHGVAWGDVNKDGSLDLLLGTFANYDPLDKLGYTSGTFKPDQLAIGSPNGFTEALADEGKEHNIRAIVLYPGAMSTNWGAFSPEERQEGESEKAPSTRVLPPERVAELIVWLAASPPEVVLTEGIVLPIEEGIP